MLRRIIFSQKKTKIESHPTCEACMNREQPRAHPAAELFSFHVIHPCLKQPLTRFRGETIQTWDKPVSVSIRWALNLRLRIKHAWLTTEEVTHLCSYTFLFQAFTYSFCDWSKCLPLGAGIRWSLRSFPTQTFLWFFMTDSLCYICVHVILNYIFILCFPPFIRWWSSCPNGFGCGLWFRRHIFSHCRCPLTGLFACEKGRIWCLINSQSAVLPYGMVNNLMKGSLAVHANKPTHSRSGPLLQNIFLQLTLQIYLSICLIQTQWWHSLLSMTDTKSFLFTEKGEKEGEQREHILENQWSRFLMFDLAFELESLFLPKIKNTYLIYSKDPYKKIITSKYWYCWLGCNCHWTERKISRSNITFRVKMRKNLVLFQKSHQFLEQH